MTNHQMIMALLKADIKNNKLILGLNEMDILADGYFTDLGGIVLQLIGFEERDDALYKLYYDFMDGISESNLQDKLVLESLALELYAQLLAEKKWRERLFEPG